MHGSQYSPITFWVFLDTAHISATFGYIQYLNFDATHTKTSAQTIKSYKAKTYNWFGAQIHRCKLVNNLDSKDNGKHRKFDKLYGTMYQTKTVGVAAEGDGNPSEGL